MQAFSGLDESAKPAQMDPIAASVKDVVDALDSGKMTSQELVEDYLGMFHIAACFLYFCADMYGSKHQEERC